MHSKTFYYCDICRKDYKNSEEALECESKGIPDSSKIPIGLMYEYNHIDFVGIFSVAKVTESYPHFVGISSWAMRTEHYPGDTIDDQTCGGGNDSFHRTDEEGFEKFKKYHYITEEKTLTPEYKRMVEYLQSKNIIPQYYNEKGELIQIK